MKIYNTKSGILVEHELNYYLFNENWDKLINRGNLHDYLKDITRDLSPFPDAGQRIENELIAPIGSQEIWAAGVTYYRSREARMDESKHSGGGNFYDRVYHADRPELFFKSMAFRAAGPGEIVRIRKDSRWNVPEPELTLLINSDAEIIGYTIGNDMSSRDIEGENPLYLPQAKSYDRAAAIGPCIYVPGAALPNDTRIRLEIIRGNIVFEGETDVSQIKREFKDLVRYLYMETTFPDGCLLMTGTGIVPPDNFTLETGDEVRITIDHIGTLVNYVGN
ncbi:MAG: 2-hydroxyhepta-2,4-diene-1,7-dioate isomerase [Balneolaceae bacterium]|nr:MAG: 2-hydroxyhepta-2,4-diene-1,7-dioate isomerase [Balneolaceae bacterium]